MKLIIGLGNPGKKYERTRHNVGFMVLDALHKNLLNNDIGDWQLSKKFNAEISGCQIGGDKIILAKPMTFMNNSGESIGLIAHYYKIAPRDIILVHDDKDILLGNVKVQSDRGHAGHNGVRSAIEHIGTQKFDRVRIGIASENEKKMQDIPKFVLNKFGILEKKKLDKAIQRSVTEINKIIEI